MSLVRLSKEEASLESTLTRKKRIETQPTRTTLSKDAYHDPKYFTDWWRHCPDTSKFVHDPTFVSVSSAVEKEKEKERQIKEVAELDKMFPDNELSDDRAPINIKSAKKR